MGATFEIELMPEPLPERTDLGTLPFAVLLARARLIGATGILDLCGSKRVSFSRGLPVCVESDAAEETSELYLLRAGAVDAHDIDPVRVLARSRGCRIGEAALSLGLVDPNELFEHTRTRAHESLVWCFGCEHGSVRWEPRERLGPEVLQVPLEVVRVISDGVLRFYDRRRLDRELPLDEASRMYVVQEPHLALDAASVGTLEARLVKLAGARPSLSSIVLDTGLSADELHRHAYVLYCLGLVGFEVDAALPDPRPAARPSSVPPAVTVPPTVRTPPPRPSTPAPPTVRTPPPRPPTPAPPTFRTPPPSTPTPPSPEAQRRSVRPPTPPAPSRSPSPRPRTPVPAHSGGRPGVVIDTGKTVSAYLEDAELARVARDFKAADLALECASELEPDNPTIWAEKAYTLMVQDARLFGRMANSLARDARRANPSLPLPYVVIGMLMEQVGETERAAKMYRIALAKNPLCQVAQDLMDSLTARKPAAAPAP